MNNRERKRQERQLDMASADSGLRFFLYSQNDDRILVCLQGIKKKKKDPNSTSFDIRINFY
jgi:hypothetical protein